jgi:hypothetical protein
MSKINVMIASRIAALKANATDPNATPDDLSRDEVLAGRVVAALKQVGIAEARIHAALDDGSQPDASTFTPADPTDPVTDDEVEAACRIVLAELGVDVEEDEGGSEDDELLDQINDLTAQVVANAGGDANRLFRAASRLTASLNLTVVAAGQSK